MAFEYFKAIPPLSCSLVISNSNLTSYFINEVPFVLDLRELLYKNIKITTKCISKKKSTHQKYLNNNYFLLLLSRFIRMKGYLSRAI